MSIAQARPIIEEMEVEKLISPETLTRDAIKAVEQDGIVFIDEIDKICSSSDKHGNVNTDFILFIASGAFHSVKPSDLMAELQVTLAALMQNIKSTHVAG